MESESGGLEMGIIDWFGGNKNKQIEDIQGNPISSKDQNQVENPGRRNFVKGVAATTGMAAVVGAHLFPGEAHAGENWKGFARRYLKDLPNGFQKDLCQEELLGLAYLYMMNGGRNYGTMRTLLTGQRAEFVYDDAVDQSVWFCDAGAHMVASATYMWKYPRETISLSNETYKLMEDKFYHISSLRRGINDFYDQHVQSDGSSNQTEKWLVHSLFSCAEEYPSRGKILAEQYLSSPFNKKVELITDLKEKFGNMSWSNSDKMDRDISGSPGKGPLNNWNRLLNAQWGAFFLGCHYDNFDKQYGDLIYNNIEIPIRKNTSTKIRGPPNYWS